MAFVATVQSLNKMTQSKLPWALLAFSAGSLLAVALYFQHVMDLQPCIKCIYQRTAVIGVLIAAIIPLIYNSLPTRILALIIWAYSALQGLLAANAHLEIIFAENPFWIVCDIVPNFPSFLALHEWLPAIFAATGDCDDNSWQFLGMGMASWLQYIFIAYLAALAGVVTLMILAMLSRVFVKKV